MRSSILWCCLLAVLSAHAITPALAGDKAKAELKSPDGKSAGTAELIGTAAGVLIKLRLTGIATGPHALHIHESGKCEGDFSSAGGIYNPLGAAHGYLNEAGPMAGDLPNVVASAAGEVQADLVTSLVTLSKDGEEILLDEDGAALVLHDKADDYLSETEGGSGAAIACGSIATTE